MALVKLTAAKEHLRIEGSEDDVEVQSKLDEAEDWASDIMGDNFDAAWDEDTVPGRIRSAILVYLTGRYDGDPDGKYLDVANRLIERWRDHVAV